MSLSLDAAGAATDRTTEIATALSPVAAALVTIARQRAADITIDAQERAEVTLTQARRERDRLLDTARASGADDAHRRALGLVADARRDAREEVLAAQRRVYDRARALARQRLAGLADSPEAAALRERLTTLARRQLGPDAVITAPPGDVGVVARNGTRSLDLTGDALLDAAMTSLGTALANSWRRDE